MHNYSPGLYVCVFSLLTPNVEVNVTRREGRPSATSTSSAAAADEGGDGAIAVKVKTHVKTKAKVEELREPAEPLKMKKRARLMKMETKETAGDVAGA